MSYTFTFVCDKIKPIVNSVEEGFMFPHSNSNYTELYNLSKNGCLCSPSSFTIPYIVNPTNEDLKITDIKISSYNFITLQNENRPLIKLSLGIIHNLSKIGSNYSNNSDERLTYYGVNNIDNNCIKYELPNKENTLNKLTDINLFSETTNSYRKMHLSDLNINEFSNIKVDLEDNFNNNIKLGVNEGIGIYLKCPYHRDRCGIAGPLYVTINLEK